MVPNNEHEARVENDGDDRHDGYAATARDDGAEESARVSRRTALGLAGLLGVGGLVGVGSAQESGLSLDGPLEVNENLIYGIDNVQASHPYPSIMTNGEGGTLQLYDNDAGAFFLRAVEDPDRSGPGPVLFNAPIRGVPEGAAGEDPIPGPLQIVDDVTVDGNDVTDVGAIEGAVTGGERLESLAGENLSISGGELQAAGGGEVSDDLETRLDDAVTRLEVVGGTANLWRAGPPAPDGTYHESGAFGILFETDRPAYLGECTIEADAAGQFTPALYEYDRSSDTLGQQVDTLTVQATGDTQTIFLDFLVDEPGEYLLTRLSPRSSTGNDDVPDDLWKPEDDGIELLKLNDYGSGFDGDSGNGVTFHGGYNPYFANLSAANDHYYYYFDLEVSSAESE